MNAAAIVLAAGASSRLHTPKQLVRFRGESLLRHTVRAALKSRCGDVIVVTGAYGERCVSELAGLPITIRHNSRWADGLSSSIRAGMETVVDRALVSERVVLLVCDQPYLEADTIDRLLEAHWMTGRGIVASRYQNALGVPALFAANYYLALSALKGDCGARELFHRFEHDCTAVPFPKGEVDIDTHADFHFLGQQAGGPALGVPASAS